MLQRQHKVLSWRMPPSGETMYLYNVVYRFRVDFEVSIEIKLGQVRADLEHIL